MKKLNIVALISITAGINSGLIGNLSDVVAFIAGVYSGTETLGRSLANTTTASVAGGLGNTAQKIIEQSQNNNESFKEIFDTVKKETFTLGDYPKHFGRTVVMYGWGVAVRNMVNHVCKHQKIQKARESIKGQINKHLGSMSFPMPSKEITMPLTTIAVGSVIVRATNR